MIPNLTEKQRSNLVQKVSLIQFKNLNLIPNQTKINKLAKQETKTQINKIRKHPKPSYISIPIDATGYDENKNDHFVEP